jgi:hypothetical protein
MTDIMLANMMGSHGFWIKDGVVERKSFVSRAVNLSIWVMLIYLVHER